MGALELSAVEKLLRLPGDVRERALALMSDEDKTALLVGVQYEWDLWCRPEQRQPSGVWDTWIMLAGRGGGKTRPGSQTVIDWSKDSPLIALMAKDDAMVRDVMIEGESGILANSPPWWRPKYDKNKMRLTWPNGSMALKLTAEAGADAARGRQFYKAWAEEVAAWPHAREAWNHGLQNAVRLGPSPQTVVTTTPKDTTTPGVDPDTAMFLVDLFLGPKDRNGVRPVEADDMVANRWSYSSTDKHGLEHRTVVVRWSTERNSANLSPGFAEKRRQGYGGDVRAAARELDAQILEMVRGALFRVENIERGRRQGLPSAPKKVCIAVDPTRSETPVDEAGIMAGALCDDDHGYLLEDATVRGTPNEWCEAAIASYRKHRADEFVYEKNRMGQMVRELVQSKDKTIRLREVTASEGKKVRAEPVSALMEQGRIHHVGHFVTLEDELCSWDPASKVSPNRMDAYVWLFTALLIPDQKIKPPIRLL